MRFSTLKTQAPLAFVLLAGALLFATGALRVGSPAGGAPAEGGAHFEGDGHDHGAEDAGNDPEEAGHDHDSAGHEHGDPAGVPAAALSFEALEKERCEHDVATVDCGSCRFELGVVKVDPALAADLLVPAAVEVRPAASSLVLTGAVRPDASRVAEIRGTAEGRVAGVTAGLGRVVAEGDLLAVLASGELGEAKAAYLQALTTHEIAAEVARRQEGVVTALGSLLAALEKGAPSPNGPEDETLAAPGLIGEWRSKLVSAAVRLRQAGLSHEREHSLHEKGISARAEDEAAEKELAEARADYSALVEEVRLTADLDRQRAANDARKAAADLLAARQRLHVFGLTDAAIEALRSAAPGEEFARLEVRAPRAGTVTAVSVVPGAFVSAGDPLFTVADPSSLWVWCDVYERDLAALAEALAGDVPVTAVVRVAPWPDVDFAGRVDLLGSEVDETTRTLKARVVVENPGGRLRPGMFARVEVSLPRSGTVRVVPRTAVLSDEGTSFVFLKWRDDLWVRRDVVVAEVRGEHAAVEGDLPEGAVVAGRGAFMLKSDVLREKMGAG